VLTVSDVDLDGLKKEFMIVAVDVELKVELQIVKNADFIPHRWIIHNPNHWK
jgi:hypothetical protein